jgi:hypothetical protein
MSRNAAADGITKYAIRPSPRSSRARSAAATSSASHFPDIAGSSAADTDMPNSETGSIEMACAYASVASAPRR